MSSFAGEVSLVVSGIESAYLRNYGVIVAEGTSLSDPDVAAAFRGIRIWCATSRVTEDEASGWFDVTAVLGRGNERDASGVSFRGAVAPSEQPFTRNLPLELGTSDEARTRVFRSMKSGEWNLLCREAFAASPGLTLLVAARVRTR